MNKVFSTFIFSLCVSSELLAVPKFCELPLKVFASISFTRSMKSWGLQKRVQLVPFSELKKSATQIISKDEIAIIHRSGENFVILRDGKFYDLQIAKEFTSALTRKLRRRAGWSAWDGFRSRLSHIFTQAVPVAIIKKGQDKTFEELLDQADQNFDQNKKNWIPVPHLGEEKNLSGKLSELNPRRMVLYRRTTGTPIYVPALLNALFVTTAAIYPFHPALVAGYRPSDLKPLAAIPYQLFYQQHAKDLQSLQGVSTFNGYETDPLWYLAFAFEKEDALLSDAPYKNLESKYGEILARTSSGMPGQTRSNPAQVIHDRSLARLMVAYQKEMAAFLKDIPRVKYFIRRVTETTPRWTGKMIEIQSNEFGGDALPTMTPDFRIPNKLLGIIFESEKSDWEKDEGVDIPLEFVSSVIARAARLDQFNGGDFLISRDLHTELTKSFGPDIVHWQSGLFFPSTWAQYIKRDFPYELQEVFSNPRQEIERLWQLDGVYQTEPTYLVRKLGTIQGLLRFVYDDQVQQKSNSDAIEAYRVLIAAYAENDSPQIRKVVQFNVDRLMVETFPLYQELFRKFLIEKNSKALKFMIREYYQEPYDPPVTPWGLSILSDEAGNGNTFAVQVLKEWHAEEKGNKK